jgi:uncharacterized protein (DUF952 family)
MLHTLAVLIYKILLPPEWSDFQATATFDGSEFDHASGFVHCSVREQLAATAQRYFADAGELVVVALDADVLGETVRWEPSADGGTYPHVHGPLTSNAVVETRRFPDAPSVAAMLLTA